MASRVRSRRMTAEGVRRQAEEWRAAGRQVEYSKELGVASVESEGTHDTAELVFSADFSPAPWSVMTTAGSTLLLDAAGGGVAVVTGKMKLREGNARLMAAAPALLEACEALVSAGSPGEVDEAVEKAKLAVASTLPLPQGRVRMWFGGVENGKIASGILSRVVSKMGKGNGRLILENWGAVVVATVYGTDVLEVVDKAIVLMAAEGTISSYEYLEGWE